MIAPKGVAAVSACGAEPRRLNQSAPSVRFAGSRRRSHHLGGRRPRARARPSYAGAELVWVVAGPLFMLGVMPLLVQRQVRRAIGPLRPWEAKRSTTLETKGSFILSVSNRQAYFLLPPSAGKYARGRLERAQGGRRFHEGLRDDDWGTFRPAHPGACLARLRGRTVVSRRTLPVGRSTANDCFPKWLCL